MYAYVESEVLGWMVRCVMYDKAKYTCKLPTQTLSIPGAQIVPMHTYTDMA